MKKIISLILCAVLCMISMCSCGNTAVSDNGLKIVCTAFPQYDYIKNILGSNEGLSLLLDDGADLLSLGVNHLKGF